MVIKSRTKSKREQRNKIIIGIMFTIFMISSAASLVNFYGGSNTTGSTSFKKTYNGVEYTFARVQDNLGNIFFDISYNTGRFTAFLHPDDINQSKIDPAIYSVLINAPFFYLTFDPANPDLSGVDYLRFDLRNNYPAHKIFQDSVISENSVYNLPIITCENATFSSPVVFLNGTNTTDLSIYNNCISFNFAPEDLLMIRDIFVYSANGVNLNG